MKLEDIPLNSLLLKIDLKDGAKLQISVGHNVETDDFDDDELEFIDALVAGLGVHLEHSLETIITMGRMSNMIKDLLEDERSDVSFEPDEELLEAIDNKKNSNVISLVKKKLHLITPHTINLILSVSMQWRLCQRAAISPHIKLTVGRIVSNTYGAGPTKMGSRISKRPVGI